MNYNKDAVNSGGDISSKEHNMDTKVTCPDCGAKSPMPADGLPDGYYTEICVNCLGTIPYDIINGVIMPWSPPTNVNKQWKGAGEPGGS